MTDIVLAVVTAPSQEKAAELARVLVEEKLAACANLVPQIRSIYAWEGKLCDEVEVLMILKTRRQTFEALRARIAGIHPYQVPEILQVGVDEGHLPYLDWVRANVRDG